MIARTYIKTRNYVQDLKNIDLNDFNKFIFKRLILHLFRTENILPFVIATCIIIFSIITQASRFIFVPQTSIASFASFIIFTIAVTFITFLIYPVALILMVNYLTSHIKGSGKFRLGLKFLILIMGYSTGIYYFTNKAISINEKIQIVLIWVGLYFVLSTLYLTQLKHNSISRLSRVKIILYIAIALLTTQPLAMIYLHISEALNFTNINPQIYLTASNCMLLHDLDDRGRVPDDNSIFNNRLYYQELPNQNGCFLYGNTIRYSFAYDFVILVKINILPLAGKDGKPYNEYVRLSCYAGNCYSENHIYIRNDNDIYADLIKKGAKLDRPL